MTRGRKPYYPSAPMPVQQERQPPTAEQLALLDRHYTLSTRLRDLQAQRAIVVNEITGLERYVSILDALERQEDVLATFTENQAGK